MVYLGVLALPLIAIFLKDGNLWRLPVMSAFFVAAAFAFVLLCFGGRSILTYYGVSIISMLLTARGFQSAYYGWGVLRSGQGEPEYVQAIYGTFVLVPLFTLVSYRFIFGAPSRRYFGLDTAATKGVPSEN